MSDHPDEIPAIRIIRFSRRVAERCRAPGAALPDWVVCDAIANGTREAVGRRGTRGGVLIRFEKTFAPAVAAGVLVAPSLRVRVLAEITPRECLALQVLAPAVRRQRISEFRGFLHRPGPK